MLYFLFHLSGGLKTFDSMTSAKAYWHEHYSEFTEGEYWIEDDDGNVLVES